MILEKFRVFLPLVHTLACLEEARLFGLINSRFYGSEGLDIHDKKGIEMENQRQQYDRSSVGGDLRVV